MKLNKKIIIPAFTLLVGTTLAGSVASTVAWYQYSTRTNVSYIGTSAGTIGNLQIRLQGGEWGTRLSIKDVEDYLLAQNIGQEVEPITSGPLAKNASLKSAGWKNIAIASGDGEPAGDLGYHYYLKTGSNALYAYENDAWEEVVSVPVGATALDLNDYQLGDIYVNSTEHKLYEKALIEKNFYENPIAGFASYEKWIKADQSKYVKLPLQLRFIQEDEQHLSPEDVYLSKLVIQEDVNPSNHPENYGDISDAVRVHFSAYEEGDEEHAVNKLVSKNGGTTLTHGKLKLEGGNDFDQAYDDDDEFGFNGSELHYINYGGTEGVQTSYAAKVNEEDGVYYEEEFPVSGWKEVATVQHGGDSEPDPATGDNGDFYRDSTANKIYQKVNGAWEVFTDSYLSGAEDPDLETGASKPYYYKTGENKLFECGFKEETISPILVSNEADSLEIGDITADKLIGSTIETAVQPDPQTYLNVDVTIWVEGWHKFNRSGSLTSIWDQDLIGAIFDVGIQFAVEDR